MLFTKFRTFQLTKQSIPVLELFGFPVRSPISSRALLENLLLVADVVLGHSVLTRGEIELWNCNIKHRLLGHSRVSARLNLKSAMHEFFFISRDFRFFKTKVGTSFPNLWRLKIVNFPENWQKHTKASCKIHAFLKREIWKIRSFVVFPNDFSFRSSRLSKFLAFKIRIIKKNLEQVGKKYKEFHGKYPLKKTKIMWRIER